MADTDERKALADLGEERGWQRRVSDQRADIYTRGTVRIRVVWQGDDKISGASTFHNEWYEAYTRDLPTVRIWLSK